MMNMYKTKKQQPWVIQCKGYKHGDYNGFKSQLSLVLFIRIL